MKAVVAYTLIFEHHFRHPPAALWAALTDPTQVSNWSPFITNDDLSRRGRCGVTMVNGESKVDTPLTVEIAEESSLLQWLWGTDLLRWELNRVTDGTRLVLHHTVHDRDMLSKVAAGWHICLAVAEKQLDGIPAGPIRGMDAMNYGFEELNEEYAKVLHRVE